MIGIIRLLKQRINFSILISYTKKRNNCFIKVVKILISLKKAIEVGNCFINRGKDEVKIFQLTHKSIPWERNNQDLKLLLAYHVAKIASIFPRKCKFLFNQLLIECKQL